jgi:hypothetical protein
MEDGIISLVNDYSVHFAITNCRISLATIIEFSHFVDLYVLEDNILVEDSAKSTTFDMFSEIDPDCPLKLLPAGKLADLIYNISDATRGIYDSAPINYTFSVDSYAYWLNLSSEEKRSIDGVAFLKNVDGRERIY